MPDEGYMDAAAVPVPDAGDDTLREQLVDLLVMSPLSDTAGTDLTPFRRTADALLPLIREHIAEAVQAERERADAWRELADARSQLLARYRMGTRPSEKLHRRLDAARTAVDQLEGHDGTR